MKKIIHPFIRFCLRITSHFFFEKIEISGKENLPLDCPVILACNHPNAFLDAIVLTSCTKRWLHYTARGDFFNSKIGAYLLRYIHILPFFRKEEGKENLHKNEETFSQCLAILKNNGAVSIFSEGYSENKWELRPLRKGTARLAFEAWNNPDIGNKLKVVPVVIHYSSWLKLFPRVYVEFLNNIEKETFSSMDESGVFNKQFNKKLRTILTKKCITINKEKDVFTQNKIIGFLLKNASNGTVTAKKLQDKYASSTNAVFNTTYKTLAEFLDRRHIQYARKQPTAFSSAILLLPSFLLLIAAWVYNGIPYLISKLIVWLITEGNDFHDSLMYCTLLIMEPIYLFFLFYFSAYYWDVGRGIENLFMALMSVYLYESSKRILFSFWKRKKLIIIGQLFSRLFEISND